jgi:hypothetical protein
MLHVFVDTNIFLSLYAYTDDNIEELKKLLGLMTGGHLKLYLSEIVNQEFNRNRDKKIQESLGNFEKFSTSISIPRFMEHHAEAVDLRALLKDASTKHSELIKKSREEIVSLSLAADKLFLELRKAASLHAITEEMDKAARLRLERGNPPGKDGSLGDRQNWEMLLKTVPNGQDLHLVSKDKDFSSPWGGDVPNSSLSMEYEALKGAKLYLYPGLRAFVKTHFPEIEIASDIEKKFAIKELVSSGSWSVTHAAIAKLAPLSADFSPEEARELFLALVNNPEIHAIGEDADVKGFYQDLLINFFHVLSKEEYEQVTLWVEDPLPF